MIEISEIRPEQGYLQLIFVGSYERPIREELAPEIKAASEAHQCYDLLFDYRQVTDLHKISLAAEHQAGRDISEIYPPPYRIALLLPTNDDLVGEHYENVIVNRGGWLKTFTELADAQNWFK